MSYAETVTSNLVPVRPKRTDHQAPEWKDQAHAHVRVVNGGAILAGAADLVGILSGLISSFSGVGDRSAAIGVDNFLGDKLQNPIQYIYSGQTVAPPTPEIPAGETGDCAYVKTAGAARGTVGVVSWQIGSSDKRLAIFWQNPYDYVSASQLHYVDIISNSTPTDYNLYSAMWSASSYATDALTRTVNGFTISSTCGTVQEMILRVSIRA
jgi:hypothetical protein